MQHDDKIINGAAEMLWALAWADHAEDTGCTDLSGCEITTIMPDVGLSAFIEAGRVIGATEHQSHANIHALLWMCLRADGLDPEACADDYMDRLGGCLAYMALGHGVSWFDDHAPCAALKVPYMSVDLDQEVAQACEACDCAGQEKEG